MLVSRPNRASTLLVIACLLQACGKRAENGNSNGDIFGVSPNWRQEEEFTEQEKASIKSARDENSQLVSAAAKLFKDNESVEVTGTALSGCMGTQQYFRVTKQNNQLQIDIPIAWIVKDDANKDVMMRELKKCDQLNQEIWARYGLKVRTVQDETSPVKVNLHPRHGRSDSRNFYVANQNGIEEPGDVLPESEWDHFGSEFCGTYIHEVGHLLGLPDEYKEEGTCRVEPYVAPHDEMPMSIMNYYSNFNKNDFLPRHLRQILDYALAAKNSKLDHLEIDPSFTKRRDLRDSWFSAKPTRYIVSSQSSSKVECAVILRKEFESSNKKPMNLPFSQIYQGEADSSLLNQDSKFVSFVNNEDTNLYGWCAPRSVTNLQIKSALSKIGIKIYRAESELGAVPDTQISLFEKGERSKENSYFDIYTAAEKTVATQMDQSVP